MGHAGLEADYCNQLAVRGAAQKLQKACHTGYQHGLTETARALSVHIASAGINMFVFVTTLKLVLLVALSASTTLLLYCRSVRLCCIPHTKGFVSFTVLIMFEHVAGHNSSDTYAARIEIKNASFLFNLLCM
jgi:hypothetical protein